MATVLSKGVIVPDPGETDWAGYLAINWSKLNDVVGAALPDVQNIWTQPQIFQNNIYLTNTSYTVGTIPTSNITATLFFAGASNYQIGYCRGVVYRTTGQTSAELTARNKFTDGALDPAGSYTNATFTVNLDADGTRWIQFANSSIKNGLIPYATDTYNIGSAANQWLRLFAKFYYYNGTAWGLDQANTWTANNEFTSINNSRPGALSLPGNSYIDISGDVTVRDGSAANELTASCDGWISINSFATRIQISDDTTTMATNGTPGADGFAQVFLPVRQGDSIRIVINQTNTQFQSFRLIPCQGNV